MSVITDEIVADALKGFSPQFGDMSGDAHRGSLWMVQMRAAIEAVTPMIRAAALEEARAHLVLFTPSHDDCISDYSAGYQAGFESAAETIAALIAKEGT
jgi:hypothetical protein